MNKKTHSQIFDSAVREHIPDHVDLTPQIMAHIQSKRKGVSMNPKLKRLVTILAVTAIFGITFANGPTVVHALQALLGYIPGVGTVDSAGSLRVLAEPVSREKDGITITIQQGTVDSRRTILTMSVTGLTATEYNPNCLYGSAHDPWLALPDGTKLVMTQLTGIGPTRYDLRYYFPSLPEGVDTATLEIPCLLYGEALVAWEIPLRFGPAEALNLFDVIEIDPATPGAQAVAQSPYRISAVLEKVVPLDDGYLFSGSLIWGDGNGPLNNIVSVTPDVIEITDADGNKLTAEWVAPNTPDPDLQLHEHEEWDYKVSGKTWAWPLTITITNVQVHSINESFRRFKVDLGANPQVGQTWVLDQDLKGYRHTIHLNSAALINDPQSGKPGLLFDIQSDTDVLDLWIENAQSDGHFKPLLSSNTRPGHIRVGLVFDDGIPAGEYTFMVGGMAVLAHGNWQMTWQP